MAELSYYEADLSDAINKLNETMEKLTKAPPGVKLEILKMAEKKMKEVVELKKGYQLALRQAPREEARNFREKFEEHSERVEELVGEVKWAKSEMERTGLFGEARLVGGAAGATAPSGNKEMLDRAVDIQKKTENSLVNTRKMVDDSKAIAVATGEQLREQRQQIVQITDEVMRMEDNLHRADRLIRSFARRMATDKLIMCFTLLVFGGIAAIVVYVSMHPNQKTFALPDAVVPPNPKDLYNQTVTSIESSLTL